MEICVHLSLNCLFKFTKLTQTKFMSQELTPDKIMQLGLGFWGSKTFLSATATIERRFRSKEKTSPAWAGNGDPIPLGERSSGVATLH
jgi:hypothetical protein